MPVNMVVYWQSWSQGYNKSRGLIYILEYLYALAKTGWGLIPLYYAIQVEHDKMVYFFLQYGANLNALSNYGEILIYLTSRQLLRELTIAITRALKTGKQKLYQIRLILLTLTSIVLLLTIFYANGCGYQMCC